MPSTSAWSVRWRTPTGQLADVPADFPTRPEALAAVRALEAFGVVAVARCVRGPWAGESVVVSSDSPRFAAAFAGAAAL